MMSDEKDELHLNNEVHDHDEDRLPWLEAVDSDADHEAHARSRITGILIAGVAALALLIGGMWVMNKQKPPASSADNTVIPAAEGDYKNKPTDAGGMKVEGQGDSAAATAQGAEGNAVIDNSAQAEAPIKPVVVAAASAPAAKPNATAKIDAVKDVTTKPAPVAAAPAAKQTTGYVQLGAFGTEAGAQQSWGVLKAKFAFLAAMTQSIAPATVGGSTVYRLRVATGDAAAETCAKLKAGGANCMVAH
jgi:cell division protein FtsN